MLNFCKYSFNFAWSKNSSVPWTPELQGIVYFSWQFNFLKLSSEKLVILAGGGGVDF